MTPSLASAEKGKPLALGRCLFATNDFPLRQPRRISNLFQFPGDAARVAAISSRRETGGRALPLGRDRLSLNLDRQFGDHAAQDFTKSLGSAAPSMFGPAHVHNMRESNAESVASAYANARS